MADLSVDILFIGCRSQRDVFPARKEKLRAERKITTGLTQRDRAQPRAAHTGPRTHELKILFCLLAVAFLPS